MCSAIRGWSCDSVVKSVSGQLRLINVALQVLNA